MNIKGIIKKLNAVIGKLFSSNRFSVVFSVVCAIVAWFVVSISVYPETASEITSVPITIDAYSEQLTSLGLTPVGNYDDYTAKVVVYGKQYIVGNLTPDDFTLTVDTSSVTSAGLHHLPVNIEVSPDVSGDVQIVSCSPQRVDVQLERMATRTLPVTAELSGITIPNGYFMDSEVIEPSEVTIVGPEEVISSVSRCVVSEKIDSTLTESRFITGDITLITSDNSEIDDPNVSLSSQTADITLTVLKEKQVELTFNYLNMPDDFPAEDLSYRLSSRTVTIAGPKNLVDNYDKINLGYVNMKDLDLDSTFEFDVSLPSGFINIDNIETVTLTFDTSDMSSNYYHVPNIVIVNPPTQYDIQIVSYGISGVKITGDFSDLSSLLSSDIAAEIEITGPEITTGQYRVPVNVYVPGGKLLWASGSYYAVIKVSKK